MTTLIKPLSLLESPPALKQLQLLVLDFDGVLTDNTVWTTSSGEESVRCSRSDGLGLSAVKALGIPVWVLSTEENPVVRARCQKLNIPVRHGLVDKALALQDLAKELNVSLEKTLYVGNDVNDVGCLRLVGFPLVVADAFPQALACARYITERPGGFGAVREVCEWIVSAVTEKPMWERGL